MNILVMKFGGTSLAEPEKIRQAAALIRRARQKGFAVAAVVSAPGHMTDEFLALAARVSRRRPARELDVLMACGEQISTALLAMALCEQNLEAVSLMGAQAGIRARGPHGSADIAGVDAGRVKRELVRGRVVVVAGFQGLDSNGDLATLGRGGSDLTAVALAAALKARACEIFTDVKGVYTADPRLVPQARKLERIGFAPMLELAQAGAQVMQTHSIAYARRHGVAIHVRSAFHHSPGTWITRDLGRPKGIAALAVSLMGKSACISAVGRGLASPDAAFMAQVLRGDGVVSKKVEHSSARVSCLIDTRQAVEALRVLHRAWRLDVRTSTQVSSKT